MLLKKISSIFSKPHTFMLFFFTFNAPNIVTIRHLWGKEGIQNNSNAIGFYQYNNNWVTWTLISGRSIFQEECFWFFCFVAYANNYKASFSTTPKHIQHTTTFKKTPLFAHTSAANHEICFVFLLWFETPQQMMLVPS